MDVFISKIIPTFLRILPSVRRMESCLLDLETNCSILYVWELPLTARHHHAAGWVGSLSMPVWVLLIEMCFIYDI